jgi:predicted anti-sigma-YlaC factor YlaD
MKRSHTAIGPGTMCHRWVERVDRFAARLAGERPLVASDRPVADHIRQCPACRKEFSLALALPAGQTRCVNRRGLSRVAAAIPCAIARR